ncbi:hypothetical protein HK096_005721 [Nowakowskiella sp. JEL0078]|nr:hypothetical protein HK096_005721 [Nowakowskiella sp. JEL0078]
MELLMVPLTKKWQITKDNDLDIVFIIECISAVSHAIGTPFGPYLPPIWHRCLNIVEKTIMQFEADPSLSSDSDEKDPMIVALDLLCSVTQDLPDFVNYLLNENSDRFFQLLFRSMQDEKLEVKQSAFALLGDLASSLFDHLKPHINTLLPYAIVELEAVHISNNQQQISVTNNAAWAVGEISLKAGRELQPFVEDLLKRLIAILNKPLPSRASRENTALFENSAISIGRLGSTCPEIIAPYLPSLLSKWFEAVSKLNDDWEKISAFKGMNAVIVLNPQTVLPYFIYFCHALASWKDETLPQDLNEVFLQLLQNYKLAFEMQNINVSSQLPADDQEILKRRYGF